MSMHTIYVLMKAGEVRDMAPSLAAGQALEFFKNAYIWNGQTGQVYACHMSDSAAQEVREAFYNNKPGTLKQTPASTLIKRYSSYMNHCADVM